MPSNIHPFLAEYDLLRADPEEQPSPPLIWISWPDWWKKCVRSDRRGIIEFHLQREPGGTFTYLEMQDGQAVRCWQAADCREGFALFAFCLDCGLPRGPLIAQGGKGSLFCLYRKGQAWWFAASGGPYSYRRLHTERCRSHKRGLIALAHWGSRTSWENINIVVSSEHVSKSKIERGEDCNVRI